MLNSVAHMLNNTMTVKRPTNATSAGTHGDTYAAHLSAIPCRWHQMSGKEAVLYGAERGDNLWQGSVEGDRDIARRDQCTFTDALGSHTVDVMEVRDSSGAGIIVRLVGREVT